MGPSPRIPSHVRLGMTLLLERMRVLLEGEKTHRSFETVTNSVLFSGFVWMRRLAVRTNWPTVAEKPARKALKGCIE